MQNKADVLFISYCQRFGPAHVGINLLQQLSDHREIRWLSVVDQEFASLLSDKIRNNIIVARNFPHLFLVLLLCLVRGKANVWHFNFPPLKLMPILLLLKVSKSKIIYSFHGGILAEKKSAFDKKLFLIQCKYLYNQIIANSIFSARLLLSNDKKLSKKIVVIPNGINLSKIIKYCTVDNLEGNPVILYVGRLEYVKGVDVLVKAISLTKEHFPEICLHIVGQGKQSSKIEEMRYALHLEKNIKLHGLVTDERVKQQFYLACDIVVVPSRIETFCVVVLEAMAAHKPLIVSNLAALPELVTHGYNGFVVPLTPEAFSKAIIDLSNERDLMNKMSEKNQVIIKNFDWQKISQKYIDLYVASYTNRT